MKKHTMELGEEFAFEIESVDLFGQGVHKQDGLVVFIPKALPGETGTAKITKMSKGVAHAKVEELERLSPERTPPECPHYGDCQGCSYLHTSYEQEGQYKKQAFSYQLQKIAPTVEVIYEQAPQRFSYRNRIQLHYNKQTKELGYITRSTEDSNPRIQPVPNCLLPRPQLQHRLSTLYQSQWWAELELTQTNGHIELYLDEQGQAQVVADAPYSFAGFTQVNQQMNRRALDIIQNWIKTFIAQNSKCLDLFGGHGNLSHSAQLGETLVVDSGPPPQKMAAHQSYFRHNLYSLRSLKSVAKKAPQDPSLLIVDPPRSGFKQLDTFVEHFQPEFMIAMSCHSSTFIRDMGRIKNYRPLEIHQLDFFPGTSHFEVLALYQRS